MTDHLDRAAEVLWASVDNRGIRGRLFREDCDYLARVLADAGLLVSPERDAEVKRLRLLAIWLTRLDEPGGIEERRTVTLTKIIDRARVALNLGEAE